MSVVKCFIIEATDEVSLYLRRLRWSQNGACPVSKYGHDSEMVHVGVEPGVKTTEGFLQGVSADRFKGDPRWPTKCKACGEAFKDDDYWQVFQDWRLRNPATGEVKDLRDWQKVPGAMYYAWWLERMKHYKAPDGKVLCLILPDGVEWVIDGPANNGPGWTRTGVPPNVTARPSILTPGYHGFLTNGELISC